ncbi:MAG: substrate-binding domain-containing protein, partial [Erysipelotrichaceae bacterium]|nr:substrate-binding domain-containing protein [Erysipelotrichaceae bacterium]
YRTQYSIEQYLESSGLEVECLVEERGMWDQAKGQEIAANALAQYGDKIEVIFCNNDGMALGAKQAIDEAGRKVGEDIYLVGVDALADAVDLIVKGEMTGTVLNDHVGQSHTAVDCAIKALNGEKLDNYYWVDYVKVTADNAADFQ